MHPAYFAVAMATGIVSIACHLAGFFVIAHALFYANLLFYPAIWLLTLTRALRHRDRFAADLRHHGRSVGFFTAVAATSVLGSQVLLIAQEVGIAVWLWFFGIALWAILTYAIFTIIIVKPEKPPLSEGINGGWLVAVVAAQSVSVLGSQVAPAFDAHAHVALFFCLVMWLGGGMLYFWIISLIFYRYTFFPMSPSDLAPPYWINMGAAAISTLAGALLVSAAPQSPVLVQALPFLRGFTVMWWATATWWIPMLLILGVWRHLYRRHPFAYDPLYWGAVFPLGMYTVATQRLASAIDAPFLRAVSDVTLYVALTAWCLVAVAMFQQLFSAVRRAPSQ